MKKSTPIPNKVHFIWLGGGKLPSRAHECFESFERHLPGYEQVLWKDSECESLIQSKFPSHLSCYDSLTNCGAKSDLVRYLILEACGGVYSDLDVHLVNDGICEIIGGSAAVFLTEAITTREQSRLTATYKVRRGEAEDRVRIASYFMASRSQHPIWCRIRELVRARIQVGVQEQYDVLYTTGPDVVSTVVNRSRDLEYRVVDYSTSCRYVTHREDGLWRPGLERGVLTDVDTNSSSNEKPKGQTI